MTVSIIGCKNVFCHEIKFWQAAARYIPFNNSPSSFKKQTKGSLLDKVLTGISPLHLYLIASSFIPFHESINLLNLFLKLLSLNIGSFSRILFFALSLDILKE